MQVGLVRAHGLLGGGDAGLGFGDLRLVHGEVGLFLIGFLARDHAALGQPPPALDGEARQIQIGLGKIQVGLDFVERGLRLRKRGARLADLLVEFGCVDFGQQLAGLDAVAVIHQPRAQVAIHAGEDGRIDQGLHVARQVERGARRGLARGGDFHHGPLLRSVFPRRPAEPSGA